MCVSFSAYNRCDEGQPETPLHTPNAALSQVHVTTYTDATMMSADEDSTSSPDDDPYDDTDILNSAGTDEITAHLAAAGELNATQRSAQQHTHPAPPTRAQ